MESNFKISIIVPFYNRIDLLNETILSVLQQESYDWEYILRSCLKNMTIQYIGGSNDEMLFMRDHESMSKNRKIMLHDTISVRKSYNKLKLVRNHKNFKTMNKNSLSNNYESLALEYLSKGRYLYSFKYLLKSSILRRNIGTLLKPYLTN